MDAPSRSMARGSTPRAARGSAAASHPAPSRASCVRRETAAGERGRDDAVARRPAGVQRLRHRAEVPPRTARQRRGDRRAPSGFGPDPGAGAGRRPPPRRACRTSRSGASRARSAARRSARPTLHSTSKPSTKASMTSRPLEPSFSPSASTAGTSGTLGWPRMLMLTSSKSSAWPEVPLTSAASLAGARKPWPRTDASSTPPCSRTISAAIRLASSRLPGERHAERVEKCAAGLFAGFLRDIARRRAGDEFGEALGDLHGGMVAQQTRPGCRVNGAGSTVSCAKEAL